MNTQRKTFNILGIGIAVLAAGLIGTAKPASAAGLTHPIQRGQQTVVRDYDGDWNNRDRDFRRQQEFRREQEIRQERQQEIRREEWRQAQRREFRDDRRDWHDDHRDWNRDNHDRHDDSLRIVIR